MFGASAVGEASGAEASGVKVSGAEESTSAVIAASRADAIKSGLKVYIVANLLTVSTVGATSRAEV